MSVMTSDSAGQAALINRLREISRHYDEVLAEMNQPEVASNPVRIVELSKEEGTLRRIVTPYRAYEKVRRQIDEAEAIVSDPSADAELKELALLELPELQAQAARTIDELLGLIVMGDEAKIDSLIMEIRAGTGGEEAALFARDLYEMYLRYAQAKGYKHEVLDASPTDMGGFREVILSLKGPGVYADLAYEGGGHRVQRVPETEAQGRIHTSAATVAVLPEPQEIEVKIDWEKDVIEHVSCAGGPGGQNVNKVSSAIRLEHIPTGITVSMRDERSQHKNRAKARRLLMSRVLDMQMRTEREKRDTARRTMIGSGDRSERIRTYNFPQNRCTDHRINQNFTLDRIVEGQLDELIQALKTHDREQRLKNLQQP
jgi:peptide chain release factor 1